MSSVQCVAVRIGRCQVGAWLPGNGKREGDRSGARAPRIRRRAGGGGGGVFVCVKQGRLIH